MKGQAITEGLAAMSMNFFAFFPALANPATNKNAKGTGFFARCLQHETDHLDGGVFLDRLTGLRRTRALRALRRADWYRPAGTG